MARVKKSVGGFKAGDKVQYKVGRGYATATIADIDENQIATLKTEGKLGGYTNRHISKLLKAGVTVPTPAPAMV